MFSYIVQKCAFSTQNWLNLCSSHGSVLRTGSIYVLLMLVYLELVQFMFFSWQCTQNWLDLCSSHGSVLRTGSIYVLLMVVYLELVKFMFFSKYCTGVLVQFIFTSKQCTEYWFNFFSSHDIVLSTSSIYVLLIEVY